MFTHLFSRVVRPLAVVAMLVLALLVTRSAQAAPGDFTQNFDGVTAPALPTGWTFTIAQGNSGDEWRTVTTSSNTSPNSAFAPDRNYVTDVQLFSPPIYIVASGAQLTFHHFYTLEDRYDGGVLEIQIGSGSYQDIMAAGGSFVSGGYNSTLYSGSPLAARWTWTGNSAAWVTTVVNLPPAATGQTIRLRWRLGADGSNIYNPFVGWYVDSITITGTGLAWTGESATSNDWSDYDNWSGGSRPDADHQDPIFGAPGAARKTTGNNNATAGSELNSVTFVESGYTIGGNNISLSTAGVTDSVTSGGNRLNLPLTLSGTTTFAVPNAGETLTLGGAVSGSGGINKTGSGTLVLASGPTDTFTGGITVGGGTLQADATVIGSATSVSSGSTLSGVGTLGNVTANGGATLSPGSPATGAGAIHVGNLYLNTNSTLVVQINGTSAIDQVSTTGGVMIGSGVTLSLSGSLTPSIGQQFKIIDNGGPSAVSGTFSGLAEGAFVTLNGRSLQISYRGGDGNDVLLTPTATVGGLKFNDANHNGTKDTGEPGLPGWTIQLKNSGGNVLQTATTGADGSYSFLLSTIGTYSVCEVAQIGWLQTLPASGCYTVNFTGTNVTGQDFGNVPYTDVSIDKTAPAAADAGEALDYTLAVTNGGPNTAPSVIMTDTLPAGISYDSATVPAGWGCSDIGSNQVRCTRTGSMPVATETLILHAKAGYAIPSASYVNSATVTTSMYDPDSNNNTDTASTTVTNNVDVGITKTTGTAHVLAGQNIEYTLVARNNGTSRAYNVAVADTMDSQTTFVSINAGAATCTTPAAGANGPVNCTIGTLEAGGAATIVVTVKLSASANAGATVADTATVTTSSSDTNSGNNSASLNLVVESIADLSVSKTAVATVDAGDDLAYTIQVTNLGPSSALGVIVADTLPISVTLKSVEANGWTCAGVPVGSTGSLTCSRATLPPGNQQLTLIVNVPAATPDTGTFTNNVTISTTSTDPVTGNNSSAWTTTVSNRADVSITKTADKLGVLAGEEIHYTLAVKNNGPTGAHAVQVTDAIPSGTSIVSFNGGNFSCTGGASLVCVRNYVAPGDADTIQLTVKVDASAAHGAQVSNTATLATSNTDPDSGNNTSTATTTVENSADLRLYKEASPAPSALAGTDLNFTLLLKNLGPTGAFNPVLDDTLIAPYTFKSLNAPAGWNCTTPAIGASGNVHCTATGTLTAGASGTFTLVAHIPSSVPANTNLSNTAAVSSATTDPNPDNNEDTATLVVLTSADLSITKAGPPDLFSGSDFTYTLVVTNNGPSDAGNLTLTDPLPAHTSLVSASVPAGWSCSGAGASYVTCTAPSAGLSSGATATLLLTVRLDLDTPDETLLINNASVTAKPDDPISANNSASASTAVHWTATVTTLTSSVNPSVFGQPVTFTANVTAGAGVPSGGDVAFKADGALLAGCESVPLQSGAANCTVANLKVGAHPIVAGFGGVGYVSSSGALSPDQTVNRADTTTTIVEHLPNPSIPGQAVTIKFEVQATPPGSGTPTGNVTVAADTGESCTGTVADGQCLVTLTHLGTRTLTATYTGDSHFNGSFTSVTHEVGTGEPVITSITPNEAIAATRAISITVNGHNMANGSVVRWNGQDRTTVFVSSEKLKATITAEDFARHGTFDVTVMNPAPGGQESNIVSFTVTIPKPKTDLGLAQTVEPSPMTPLLKYTFTVTNYGPNVARRVFLSEVLPPEVKFVSSTGGCNYNSITRQIMCKRALLGVGQMWRVIVRVKWVGAPGATTTNCGLTDSKTYDYIWSNNNACVKHGADGAPISLNVAPHFESAGPEMALLREQQETNGA